MTLGLLGGLMLDVALPNLQSLLLLGVNPGSCPLPRAPALSNLAVDCLLGPGSLQFLTRYPALCRLRLEYNPPLGHPAVNLPVDLLRVLGQHAPGLQWLSLSASPVRSRTLGVAPHFKTRPVSPEEPRVDVVCRLTLWHWQQVRAIFETCRHLTALERLAVWVSERFMEEVGRENNAGYPLRRWWVDNVLEPELGHLPQSVHLLCIVVGPFDYLCWTRLGGELVESPESKLSSAGWPWDVTSF
jgi:hypothetical protein